jgi:hypothetical protein
MNKLLFQQKSDPVTTRSVSCVPPPFFQASDLLLENDFEFSRSSIESILKQFQAYFHIQLMKNDHDLSESFSNDLKLEKTVAVFRGNLSYQSGCRSIFVNPTMKNIQKMKVLRDSLSSGREGNWLESFPVVVLKDEFPQWFENSKESLCNSELGMLKSPSNLSLLTSTTIQRAFPCQLLASERNLSSFLCGLLAKFHQKSHFPLLIHFPFQQLLSDSITLTPLSALQNLLSNQGAVDVLYLDKYRVSLKTFPLDIVNQKIVGKEPSIKEEDLFIKGRKLLKTELTYEGNMDKTALIRIQDSSMSINQWDGLVAPPEERELITNITEAKRNVLNDWKILPSELHLEILQIMQEIPDFSSFLVHENKDEEGSEQCSNDPLKTQPMTIGSLWNYLKELHKPDDLPSNTPVGKTSYPEDIRVQKVEEFSSTLKDNEKKVELLYEKEMKSLEKQGAVTGLTWNEVKKALAWLYYEGLVEIMEDESARDIVYPTFSSKEEKPSEDMEDGESEDEAEGKAGELDLTTDLYDPELEELRKQFPDTKEFDYKQMKWIK